MGFLNKILGLEKKPDVPFIEITDENFEEEVLQSDKPVMFFVWSNTCPHCQKMAPNVLRAAQKHVGNIKAAQAGVSAAPGVMSKLGVRGVPTVFFFQGGEIVERFSGFRLESYLDEVILTILGGDTK
jgi:thioredoxin